MYRHRDRFDGLPDAMFSEAHFGTCSTTPARAIASMSRRKSASELQWSGLNDKV
jgi:hypothetical protein